MRLLSLSNSSYGPYGYSILTNTLPTDQHSVTAGFYKILVDYQKLKLFIISVLWRAHITTLPEFSNTVLEPEIADKVKDMLIHTNAGDPSLFSIILSRYYTSDPTYKDLPFALRVPVKSNHPELVFFSLQLLDYNIIINVGSRAFPDEFQSFVLSEKQNLKIKLRDYLQSKDY